MLKTIKIVLVAIVAMFVMNIAVSWQGYKVDNSASLVSTFEQITDNSVVALSDAGVAVVKSSEVSVETLSDTPCTVLFAHNGDTASRNFQNISYSFASPQAELTTDNTICRGRGVLLRASTYGISRSYVNCSPVVTGCSSEAIVALRRILI